MPFPLVYIINLDGSDRRMDEMRAELDREGLSFTRVPAVDGRGRPAQSFPEYRAKRTIGFLNRELLGGEVACSLSHLACVKRFLATDAPYALVLEDDSVLAAGFAIHVAELVVALEQQPSRDWHVVHLSSPGLKISTRLERIGQHALHHAHYFPMRTTTILWSRAGAQAFVDLQHGIFAPIDMFFRYWVTRTGKGMAINPPLALDRMGTSDIDTVGDAFTRQGGYRGVTYFLRKQRRMAVGKFYAYRHLLSVRVRRAVSAHTSRRAPGPVPAAGEADRTDRAASQSSPDRIVAASGG